jgi:hypothetical protein
MVITLQGHEPRCRGSSTVGRGNQAVQLRPWLQTLVFVWWWFLKCSHEMFKSSINRLPIQTSSLVTLKHAYNITAVTIVVVIIIIIVVISIFLLLLSFILLQLLLLLFLLTFSIPYSTVCHIWHNSHFLLWLFSSKIKEKNTLNILQCIRICIKLK